jgi:hypothetical protein
VDDTTFICILLWIRIQLGCSASKFYYVYHYYNIPGFGSVSAVPTSFWISYVKSFISLFSIFFITDCGSGGGGGGGADGVCKSGFSAT